jgi:hypothetical protein
MYYKSVGAAVLNICEQKSCNFALEIAVGTGYHAVWKKQGVLQPARGRVVPAEFRQKIECDFSQN